MSKKIRASRRRAFLDQLARTGNQTLSAERAKVSRSWVQLHRSTDPGFEMACREAIAAARARLEALAGPERTGPPRGDAASPAAGGRGADRPAAGRGFLDGVELVVRGTGGSGGGKRVQVGRARLKQWTPRVEERFLMALMATCNVKAACAEAGMSHSSAYAHRKRRPAFARHWAAALEIGFVRLEAALVESTCSFFSGEPVDEDNPLRVTSVGEAIQALNLYKFAVKKER